MTISTTLAQVAHLTSYDAAPPPAQRRVRAVVADVFATMVAAASRPELAALRSALARGTGPASVIGRSAGTDATTAALLNGTLVAAQQLQEGHRLARGHPASHVVPAVVAVGEAQQASGRAVLSAILAGYEVGVRIGVAMGGTPPGVHDIATWGSVGAAAGVAHLVGGAEPEPIAHAIDLAASAPMLPDARTVVAGATGQHVFLGLGAHAGAVWGVAAGTGLRGVPGTFERHFGRFVAPQLDCAALADPAAAVEPAVLGGYLKRHPTCAHLHGVNDALERLLAHRALRPEDVERIEVRTYAAAATYAEPHPANELAARFSIPFTVAVAIVTGGLGDEAFEPTALADPRVRALADRVRVRHDPALDAGHPGGRPSFVAVHLRNGDRLEESVQRPRGDGPDALHDPDVRAKPRRLLAARIGTARTDALLDAIEQLAGTGLPPLTAALRALAPLA